MTDENAKNLKVQDYNNDTNKALTKSLSYGSLKRTRSNLAELAGLAANDNNEQEAK